MKKSELRKLIKEEILKENYNSFGKELDKFGKKSISILPKLKNGLTKALSSSDWEKNKQDFALERFENGEKYLTLGIDILKQTLKLMNKLEG